nr:gustatory receptor 49 [Papilio memnon]
MVSEENKYNILAKNYIHVDFEKVLFPLTLTQYFILSPKYYLCQNYIRPNSVFTNVILCSLTVIIFVCFLYFSFKYLIDAQVFLNDFLGFLYYLENLIYAFGYLFNGVFLIVKSRVNVELIVCIQIIINNLGINKSDKQRIIFGNWIFCFLIFLFYFLNTYIQLFHAFTTYVIMVLSIFIHMPLDFNIVYATRILYLLRKQTENWMMHLNYMLNASIEENNTLGKYRWQSMLKGYLSIIDAYYICEKITEIPVIYHVILIFVQLIVSIQTVIQVIIKIFQIKTVSWVLMLCVMWSFKHGILLAVLSLECENFFMCLKNSQVACLTTAYQNIPVSGHQVCKRLRKESRKQLQPMTAKGFFNVNAALLLNLFSIVATYVVVLLQFNFL